MIEDYIDLILKPDNTVIVRVYHGEEAEDLHFKDYANVISFVELNRLELKDAFLITPEGKEIKLTGEPLAKPPHYYPIKD